MASRLRELRHWARGREFDIALAHGSHELTMTARRLGIPSSTTFDYEFAWLQHQLGCRAATRVVVPEAIPPERLERYGGEPPKLLQYPGLKEEYYLADFEPDPVGARAVRGGRGPHPRSGANAAGRLALPPALEPALPADARPPGTKRDGARDRPAADSGAARLRPRSRPAVGDRSGPGRRRPEPDRLLRPRRLGRRDDEPRGSGARRARLHDLRREARRSGRAADPRGPPDPAQRPARTRPAQARWRAAARAPRSGVDARALLSAT